MNVLRYRRPMIVLIPALMVVFALCFWRPARTQRAAMFRAPVRAALVVQEQTAGFHSVSHPFAAPLDANGRNRGWDWMRSGSRNAPVATGPNAAWYSAGVNNVLCSLLLPDETWLGTTFGVKRLNLQTRQTQHYTSLDGLPYHCITALAARNGVLVCAAVRREARGRGRAIPDHPFNTGEARVETIALCRFDAPSGKWSVLDEARREYAVYVPPDGMEMNAVPPQCVAVNRAFACLVPGTGLPGQPMVLLCRLSDGRVDHVVAPEFIKQPLAITSVQMDEQYLWLGTSRGLLRCHLETRRWETLLPDAAIYSSTQAEDGSVWALAKTSGAFRADMQQGQVRDVRWTAVHLREGQILREYPLKNRVEAKNAWAPAFLENITLAEGKVWATVNIFGSGIHGQMAYLPDVYSLDPQTGQVTTQTSVNGDPNYDQIPTSVLANSHTGWGILTPLRIPARFPGWICEAEAGEAAQLIVPNRVYDAATPQRAEWSFVGMSGSGRNGKFLRRQARNEGGGRQEPEELYAPPSARFDVQDQAFWPVSVKDAKDGKDKTYFLSGEYDVKLRVWDRAANTISTPPVVEAALKRYKPEWSREYRLLPGRNCLWIGTGEAVLRYDLIAGRVDGAQENARDPGSSVPRHALLAVEGDTAWLKGPPNLLFTANPLVSADLTPVPLPPFPGGLERSRDKLALFALEDHIAWFTGISFIAPNDRVLIGYNLTTRTWTPPINASLPLISAGQTIATYKEGHTRWFSANAREASGYGYDLENGRWTTLPSVPANENQFPVDLVAVDARHAWYCDHARLHRLDRQEGTWHHDALPFTLSGFRNNGVTRAGDALYFGTSGGAWRLDTNTGKWTQSPGAAVTSDAMNYQVMAVDAQAVWLTVSLSDTRLVARFDRRTHVWKYWSAGDGLPSKYGDLTADGQSCWLLAEGILYHLNLQTNRWDNISRRLADGKQSRDSLGIRQILVDGGDVWLVPDTRSPQSSHQPAATTTPLYRYEIATQKLTPVQPAPGKSLTPGALTATDKALLLAAREGVYQWNRAEGKWRRVSIPAVPASFPPLVPTAAREDQANLWLLSDDNALRFRRPRP